MPVAVSEMNDHPDADNGVYSEIKDNTYTSTQPANDVMGTVEYYNKISENYDVTNVSKKENNTAVVGSDYTKPVMDQQGASVYENGNVEDSKVYEILKQEDPC